MKEKQLLRNYEFRKYLEYLNTNRRDFKKLSNKEKVLILKGFTNVTGGFKEASI